MVSPHVSPDALTLAERENGTLGDRHDALIALMGQLGVIGR